MLLYSQTGGSITPSLSATVITVLSWLRVLRGQLPFPGRGLDPSEESISTNHRESSKRLGNGRAQCRDLFLHPPRFSASFVCHVRGRFLIRYACIPSRTVSPR